MSCIRKCFYVTRVEVVFLKCCRSSIHGRWTEWGSTCRKLSHAQDTKSV